MRRLVGGRAAGGGGRGAGGAGAAAGLRRAASERLGSGAASTSGSAARGSASPSARLGRSRARRRLGRRSSARLRERRLDRGRRVAAVLVHAAGQVQQQLLGVDPRRPASRRVMSRAPTDGGALVGQAEAELALAQADELLQRHLDAAAQDGRPRFVRRAAARRAGRAGRLSQVKRGHHEARRWKTMAPSPAAAADGEVARLLAEGDDLEDVEERAGPRGCR